MKTAGQIFSMVQTDVNDISGARIELAEYVDHLQIVGEDIAMEIKAWLRYKTYVPNKGTNPTYPAPFSVVIPASDNLIKILRITRNGIECQEYSRHAAGAQSFGNPAFSLNSVVLPKEAFYSFKAEDESLVLTFVQPFDTDEEVYVEALSGTPFVISTWTQNISVPDFLFNSFYYGLKLRVFERFFNSGLDAMMPRMQYAEKRYIQAIAKAKAYANNFKDEASPIERQSHKFLSDGNTMPSYIRGS